MKIPGLRSSKGETIGMGHTRYLSQEEDNAFDYASGSTTTAAMISPRHHHHHHHQHHQQTKPTSPRRTTPPAESPEYATNVQNYGPVRMKSKTLMAQFISPRSYSKFTPEEERRRRDMESAYRHQYHAPNQDDLAEDPVAAERAQLHPMDDPADKVWLGFDDQQGPSEAVIEQRKYRQAQAIDYYMRNGMKQQQQQKHENEHAAEQDQVINYNPHPQIQRHQLQPHHVAVMDSRLNEVSRSGQGYPQQHYYQQQYHQSKKSNHLTKNDLSADDLEAIGDEHELGLEWVAHEQRKSKKAGRARSLSTGDKYKQSSSKFVLKTKSNRREDETPMLRYY